MKLLLSAPCNIVIEDQTLGHSLIGVFHEIKIQISSDAPTDIPNNALIPKEWAMFFKFELTPEEEGKVYSLTSHFLFPDGNPFVSQTFDATPPTKNGLSFIVRLQAFPMAQEGMVAITSTLSCEGQVVCGPIEHKIKVVVERSLAPAGVTQ